MPVVSDSRTQTYIRMKYRAWDVRNREKNYRRCFGYRARWSGLLQESRDLRERGWTVGILSYNAILRRYAGVGKWQLAEQTLADMRENGVQPTKTSWRHLLNAIGRSMSKNPKFLKKIQETWSHISNDSPTLQDYHALVRSLCLAKQPSLAFRVIQELESHGIQVTESFYEPLIRASYKRWKFVLAICKKIWPARHTITLQSVLKSAAWNGKKGSAAGLVQHLSQRAALTTRMWALLLRAYVRSGDLKGAVETWDQISQQVVDDVVFKEYAQLLLLGLRQGAYDDDYVSSSILFQFNQLQQSNLGKSIHAWGAVSEVLIQSNKVQAMSNLYSLYLEQVGKPWSPNAVIVKRMRRAFRKLKNRKQQPALSEGVVVAPV
eukprot:TRINITY_DN11325_c0_g1_i1.p1 TRINITY_DN11325_c0_g1~~TRINITY_DN11325_c0_g1_i1.p1  ORF type:complete len:377 (+),score=31.88 TRINITY_DN11325_c0_g1_i1:115-1245(+)